MLKKIPISQLRVGMYLLRIEGGWLSHPFWRARFVIPDPETLARVAVSGITEVWIDTDQGLDVATPEAAQAPVAASAPAPIPAPVAAAPAPAAPAPVVAPLSRAFGEELREAAAICNRSRRAVAAMFGEARMGRTVDAEACLPLVEEIAGSVMRNPGALVSLARLKTRDDYTYMHSVAVCALMVALGRRIGLDEDACREAGLAGLMHDIGKAMMPLDVLNKPGKLTPEEFDVMREHPQRGHAMLKEGSAGSAVLDVALHHHERMDGTGYPHRLAGEAITRLARMGAICDVYDAITSNRPYKTGWDPATSIARMASWKGHFDPALFAAFVQSLGIYPTGSLVRLASQRVAVVAEQNDSALTAPVVVAFYSLRSAMQITPLRVDLSKPGTQDRIVGRDDSPPGHYGRIEELWADPELLRQARAG